jgi:hypothetical protein
MYPVYAGVAAATSVAGNNYGSPQVTPPPTHIGTVNQVSDNLFCDGCGVGLPDNVVVRYVSISRPDYNLCTQCLRSGNLLAYAPFNKIAAK